MTADLPDSSDTPQSIDEIAASLRALDAVMPGPEAARLRLRSLVYLARAMAEPRPFDDLVEVGAQEIRFALGAASVSIGRLERERGLIRVLVNVGDLAPHEELRPRDELYPLGDFPLLSILVEEAQTWTFDPADPMRDPVEAALIRSFGKAYSMGAPILLDGRVWGELYVTRHAGDHGFDEDDVALAEALSAVLGSGVAQASRVSLVERLAYEDPLTGLANRRAIDLRLEEALDARASTGRPVAVVMADVNRLKQINDESGHEAGDRVLVAVANAIALSVGQVPGGLAGRIGGDEFCVVLDGIDGDAAIAVAQSMVDRLDEGAYTGALSCGVAATSSLPPSQPVTGRQLLRWADEAQYSAKRAHLRVPLLAGRDTVMMPAAERRTLRGTADEDRRVGDHVAPDVVQRALTLGLAAVNAAGSEPQVRLVRLLDAVCDALVATGWVLSRIEFLEATAQTVAFAQTGESSRPEAPVVVTGGWVALAKDTGVVSRRGDAAVPLADLRVTDSVAAAVVGDWLLEVLADGQPLDGVPAVLRALGSVAVAET